MTNRETLFDDPFEIPNKRIELLKKDIQKEWDKAFPAMIKFIEAGQTAAAEQYRQRAAAYIRPMQQELLYLIMSVPPFVIVNSNGVLEKQPITPQNSHLLHEYLK